MSKTNPARGMRDFLPSDVRKRNYVTDVIKRVYEKYGFEPLETPAVENIETLTGKYGEEGNQLIFKILKRGEKLKSAEPTAENQLADLALRYDLTVPLARVVANNKNELPKFFKRYQIQPVWRADRPARGRYREFYQCDVDAIGSTSIVVEAELISAVSEILNELGFTDFEIRLNHREILADILDTAGVPANLRGDALVAIDKLDKIGVDGVAEELSERGISPAANQMLLNLFATTAEIRNGEGDVNRTIISNLLNIVDNKILSDIASILNLTAGLPVFLDPSLARGLSYYTGSIMEIVLTNGDFSGSIAGGGRYDGLIGMFGKEQIPACGVSLGLERILVVMEERGLFPSHIADQSAADVLMTIWSDESVTASLKLAKALRSNNIRVLVYPEVEKLGKQLKYADAIKAPFVCILGESELADGNVTVKCLKDGEQNTVSQNEAAAYILEKLNV